MKRFIAAIALAVLTTFGVAAQDSSASLDLTSRYVWRGLDQGDGLAIQPSFSLETDIANIGVWGSSGIANGISEVDIFASRVINDNLTVVFTDYYTGGNYLNFSGNEVIHELEVGLSYRNTYGLSSGYVFVQEKSEDPSVWLQHEVNNILGAKLTLGGGTGRYTKNGEVALTLIGLSVKLDSTLSIDYLVNPDQDQAWIVGTIQL